MGVLDQFRLEGKVAVVTGASSGLGVAFACALAEVGAGVALGARRVEGLEATRRLIEDRGGECIAVPCDVTRADDCDRLVLAAVTRFGHVDVLVNNAGVGRSGAAQREPPGAFARVLDVNLVGSFLMAQAFGRACIEARHGGSIINVSSALALAGSPIPQAAYSASKAGLLGLTRDLARQWSGRYAIRVNALAPGFFPSEMTDPLLSSESGRDMVIGSTPMARIGAPEELLGPLLLLASDAGSFITGVTLAVDGGWSLH